MVWSCLPIALSEAGCLVGSSKGLREIEPARSILLFCAIAIALLLLTGANAAQAAITNGGYYLPNSCCAQPLDGTRASISAPVSYTSWHLYYGCLAALSRASDVPNGYSIATGIYRCLPGFALDVNPPCLAIGPGGTTLEAFVETVYPGLGYSCYQKGDIAYQSTHKFTVMLTAPFAWQAFIDGAADNHPIAMGNATKLDEELSYTDTCGSPLTANAVFGSTTLFQRYDGATWFTVQQQFPYTGCGWHNTAGPPNAWNTWIQQ